MSSILKALKRLERDRARRQDDNLDLARDILRGDGRRLGPPAWLLPALLVLSGLLALLLLVLLCPRGGTDPASVGPPISGTPAVSATALEPAVVEEILPRRKSLPASPPARTGPATNISREPARTAASVGGESALAITALVYSDDRSARMAVVNDLPVMEGTLLGEIRVEEILPDRVVFTRGGVRFAVPVESH